MFISPVTQQNREGVLDLYCQKIIIPFSEYLQDSYIEMIQKLKIKMNHFWHLTNENVFSFTAFSNFPLTF